MWDWDAPTPEVVTTEDLVSAATATFEDRSVALRWLSRPCRTLGGQVPIECPPDQVINILGRIEHGVFS